MAYGRGGYNRGGGGRRGGGKKMTSVRISGLFKTKRQGLWVGSATDEQLDALIKKIKEAKSDGKGISLFLWKNTFDDGPAFSIHVDVEQERQQQRGGGGGRGGYGGGNRRRIEPDDDPEPEADEEKAEGDDLFGDDD